MDANQFVALYEPMYKDLYRFALYIMGKSSDAEDAVSESVLSAWEKRDQLRNEDSFKPWLFQITANTCRKNLKKLARVQPSDVEDLEPIEPSHQLDAADSAAVRELFSKLDDDDRLIIALSVFGGYTSDEIGGILSMNSNTVRSRRKRALDRLKAQWEGAKQ